MTTTKSINWSVNYDPVMWSGNREYWSEDHVFCIYPDFITFVADEDGNTPEPELFGWNLRVTQFEDYNATSEYHHFETIGEAFIKAQELYVG